MSVIRDPDLKGVCALEVFKNVLYGAGRDSNKVVGFDLLTKEKKSVFHDESILKKPVALRLVDASLCVAGYESNTVIFLDLLENKLDTNFLNGGVYRDPNLKGPCGVYFPDHPGFKAGDFYILGEQSKNLHVVNTLTGKRNLRKFTEGIFTHPLLKRPRVLSEQQELGGEGWDEVFYVGDPETGALFSFYSKEGRLNTDRFPGGILQRKEFKNLRALAMTTQRGLYGRTKVPISTHHFLYGLTEGQSSPWKIDWEKSEGNKPSFVSLEKVPLEGSTLLYPVEGDSVALFAASGSENKLMAIDVPDQKDEEDRKKEFHARVAELIYDGIALDDAIRHDPENISDEPDLDDPNQGSRPSLIDQAKDQAAREEIFSSNPNNEELPLYRPVEVLVLYDHVQKFHVNPRQHEKLYAKNLIRVRLTHLIDLVIELEKRIQELKLRKRIQEEEKEPEFYASLYQKVVSQIERLEEEVKSTPSKEGSRLSLASSDASFLSRLPRSSLSPKKLYPWVFGTIDTLFSRFLPGRVLLYRKESSSRPFFAGSLKLHQASPQALHPTTDLLRKTLLQEKKLLEASKLLYEKAKRK
ncbi:MAG: hypothetical protein HYS58_03495, partial [Elusimicrobia bacterium]|nr:hypothetical protein [Elusimicrobiota bacterium]